VDGRRVRVEIRSLSHAGLPRIGDPLLVEL
jgi:hypothetical protein